MMNRKKVAVLGVTGSIGRSTADVLAAHPDRFETVLVAARDSIDELAAAAEKLHASAALTTDMQKHRLLKSKLHPAIACRSGLEELISIVSSDQVDIVLCAIVGTAGIRPVLSAIEAGKTIALASKEVMVAAGDLVNAALAANPAARLIPVDSEHSGVFQALNGSDPENVDTIWLTASGGPFRTWSAEAIANASLQDALAHPTWNMGRKITIDSASMMNKALELVEARYLFSRYHAKLDVVIHPQSAVHAMVEFTDGSLIAHCAFPDMRLPIAYALGYPERINSGIRRLSLTDLGKMEFFEPDHRRFPAFDFAEAALQAGGTLPCAMNAANEVAVSRFCNGEIKFGDIYRIIDKVMNRWQNEEQRSFDQLTAADETARRKANEVRL